MSRIEKDSMGDVAVPDNAMYGAQTQRAVENFPISGLKMPRAFIRALGLIKGAAAQANAELKLLDVTTANAISKAAQKVASGECDEDFPIDVFQSGSGTSTNMNANEVIAHLVFHHDKISAHANDQVNMGQSSNDVIPASIHVSCSLEVQEKLLPALELLASTIEQRATELKDVAKTGRTHLMDAMPVTFGQELSGWATQVRNNIKHIKNSFDSLTQLQLGGTAVGTGINTHPNFSTLICKNLSAMSKINFRPMPNFFAGLSAQDTVVELSAQLRGSAIILTKISNDLRWMNSGPKAGLSEIHLPDLQPGSSIMPGKVNPVIPEAVCMLSAQVMGNDLTIAQGGQSGNFQLNVMLTVIAYNILQSIQLISNGASLLATKAIAGFTVNQANINTHLATNPIIITALNSVIGYEKGAEIAKKAYKEGRSIKDVAREMTNLSDAELNHLLDPQRLTSGGVNERISK